VSGKGVRRPRLGPRTAWLAVGLVAFAAGCGPDAAVPFTPPVGGPSTGPTLAASTARASGPIASTEPSPSPSEEAAVSPSSNPLTLESSAFDAGKPIPAEYTCHGADRSPPLAWTGVPADAAALVLFVDDPDGGDWVHWSVLDLDPATSSLPAGVPAARPQQGTNDFGRVGYGGPCPPSGTHRYRFTLSALAAPLGLAGHPDGAAVRSALEKAHVLDRVTLVGTFRA